MGLFGKGKVGMNPGRPRRFQDNPKRTPILTEQKIYAIMGMFAAVNDFRDFVDPDHEEGYNSAPLAEVPADLATVLVQFIQKPSEENLEGVVAELVPIMNFVSDGLDTYNEIEPLLSVLISSLHVMAEAWNYNTVKRLLSRSRN